MKRDNYRSNVPCVCCGHFLDNETCLHHLVTRKSGGTDDDYNLISVCLRHHNEFHAKGTSHMANKYPSVKQWLLSSGWVYNEFLEKWIINKV